MTITVTQIANTQTFGTWLATTNRLANLMSQNVVTADASLGGSVTTGNTYIDGHFGAQYVYVANTLKGGNLSSNGALTIQANLAVTNSSSNIFFITANSTASVLSFSGSVILNSIGHQFANSYTFLNSSTAANIDVVSASLYRSFEYLVQLVDSTITPNPYYHSTKISIIHDSTTAYITEYGTLFNIASLGSFDVVMGGGNIGLQLTPTTANVVAKFIRTSIVQ
jgi:hypothetical protein